MARGQPARAHVWRWIALGIGLCLAPLPAMGAHGVAGPIVLVSAPELKAEIDAGRRPLLVDLRPADAFRAGRVPGARSIPLTELRRRVSQIPRGRVVLYCDCPQEQMDAAYRFLIDHGAEQVVALDEGFAGWTRRGYPVER